uniref:Membrane transporter protein n=1 Tax=Tetradesmus obliquus TaxID=3088 RepID=A0A383VY93_TETOB
MHAVRLLLLAALVIACLGEFTDPPLVETPQTRSDPEALLSSLASLSTSGVAYGVASWEREATRHASAAPASHAAGSKHEPAAAQRSEHDQQYEKAGQPLQPPHKALFPLGTRDLATLLLTIITLFIAAGGGIGGGAVFIVCYVFVGGFTPAQAVALSNITILGGSLANFIANSSRRHPMLDRPLIDWDLILVMEPTTMLGALLGGYLNKLFPVWLTSCLLAGLLLLLTYKLLKRGASTFAAETRIKQQQQQHGEQHEKHQHWKHGKQRHSWWRSRRAAAAAAAGDSDSSALAEPLLDSSKGVAGVDIVFSSNAVDRAAAAAGRKNSEAAVSGSQSISQSGAWIDAGVHAGDQQAHQQQQQQQQNCEAAAGACSVPEAAVLPVPAGLRPLNIGSQDQQQQQQQQQQQRGTPLHPWRASSAPGSGLLCSPGAQQQQQQQQYQLALPMSSSVPGSYTSSDSSQIMLLLPHYAPWQQQQQQAQAAYDNGTSSSSSSLCCCLWRCCSCFDAARLQLSTELVYERQQLPWQPLVVLLFLSCWVVVSDTSKAALVCGSLQYWLVVLSVAPPAAIVVLLVRQWLLAKTAVKEAAAATAAEDAAIAAAAAYPNCYSEAPAGEQQCPQYEAVSPPPMHAARSAAAAAGSQAAAVAAAAAGNGSSSSSVAFGGIHWTPRNSLLYPALCSTAGVVAGLFGVGGGIVKGPLMLELGVCPEVAAATSATMIAFTAGSAAVVYVNFGGVVHDYALALLAVGFVITLLGQLVTIRLVKALGRRSVIIFMMGGLMVLASGAAGYQSVVSVAAALHDPRGMWAWGSVCKHH